MRFTQYLMALLVAVGSQGAWSQSTFTADLVPLGQPGAVELLGFGRGGSELNDPLPALRLAPQLIATSATSAAPVPFWDRWFVEVDPAVAPGPYAFSAFTIEATGSVQFSVVTFNSYDASLPPLLPILDTVLFDVNATGTQAVGSGAFTVRSECPVSSCIYIDVFGTQLAGDSTNGYNGQVVATLVPEPASWALLALGLIVVGSAIRRVRG